MNVSPANPSPDPPRLGTRRRCANCPKFYTVVREHQRFCCAQCRREFHRYGSSYGHLKEHLEQLIERLIAERVERIAVGVVEQLIARATGNLTAQIEARPSGPELEGIMRSYLRSRHYLTRGEIGGEAAVNLLLRATARVQRRAESGQETRTASPEIPVVG